MDTGYDGRGVVSTLNSTFMVYLSRGLMLLVLAIFVLGGYAMLQFHGLRDPEAMRIAESARNLAAGRGFATRAVTPFDRWYLKSHAIDARGGVIPNLHDAPAYPWLLSGFLRLTHPSYNTSDTGKFDAEYKAVVPLGALLTLLGALALFLIARHLFGDGIAGLATVIYLLSNLTLSFMISGLPLPLESLLVTVAFGFVVRAIHWSVVGDHLFKELAYILAGALCAAAAILSNYTLIVVAVVLVGLLAMQLQRQRWLGVVLFVLVAVLAVLPWMVHNHGLGLGVLRAAPYHAIENSSLYPGKSLACSVAPQFNSYRSAAAIKHKIVTSFADSISGYQAAAGGVVVCFFVLALFHRFEKPIHRALKWSVATALLLLVPVAALIGPGYSSVPALFPLVVLLGAAVFIDYINREELFDPALYTILIWALALVTALPTLGNLVTGGKSAYPPYYPPLQRFVCGMVKDGEFIYTDIPAAAAWYGGVSSLLLPQSIADLESASENWLKPAGIYLTSATYDPGGGAKSDWPLLFAGKIPAKLPFRYAIEMPPGRAEQIFVTDRPRWSVGKATGEDDSTQAADE